MTARTARGESSGGASVSTNVNRLTPQAARDGEVRFCRSELGGLISDELYFCNLSVFCLITARPWIGTLSFDVLLRVGDGIVSCRQRLQACLWRYQGLPCYRMRYVLSSYKNPRLGGWPIGFAPYNMAG
jgi:hypothetical protein